MKLSIITPTAGKRDTLSKALASVVDQLEPGDELLLDCNDGAWGNEARTRRLRQARGDFVLFLDDDDRFTPDALAIIRAAASLTPDRIHVFRMRYANGRVLWQEPVARLGNVSGQMLAVPVRQPMPEWGDTYEGDWMFLKRCMERFGLPLWHEDVVVEVRPWAGQSQVFG